MTRRYVGVGLLVAAIVLAIAAFVMWQAESDDAETDQLAHDYAEAISGRGFDDVEPNRAPSIAVGAVSGVLFLSGVIVLTVSPASDS